MIALDRIVLLPLLVVVVAVTDGHVFDGRRSSAIPSVDDATTLGTKLGQRRRAGAITAAAFAQSTATNPFYLSSKSVHYSNSKLCPIACGRSHAAAAQRYTPSSSSSTTRLYSTAPPYRDGHNSDISYPSLANTTSRRDFVSIATHLLGCATTASILSLKEDYDCSYLKPLSGQLRHSPPPPRFKGGEDTDDGMKSIVGAATRGMGQNSIDREKDWYELHYGMTMKGDVNMRDVPSYNEIMYRHRTETVPRWKNDASSASVVVERDDVRDAVQSIYAALDAVFELCDMANEYNWEEMKTLIRSPVLTLELDKSTSLLRNAVPRFVDVDGRDVIGFDWGSCAWRHCGAKADAQESLAELYNSIGMFEPYECLFCLDIIERSLRDILDVIPQDLHPIDSKKRLKPYVPYKSQGDTGNGEGAEDSSSIDFDFLRALSTLRNDLSNDDD